MSHTKGIRVLLLMCAYEKLSPTSKDSFELWLVQPEITALDPSSLQCGNRTWSLKSRPMPGMIIMSLAKASPVMLMNWQALASSEFFQEAGIIE